ncbi:uncharacterized protein TNCV_3969561 [Trichonephila clavipes]|nr:uncharacterized protein TNCV_3969561 [Trichonephila clavipes]
MSFDNALWKAAFTRMASNTNAAIMAPQIEARRWFAVKGVLYKGPLARNPWYSRRRRIDEADISTPVAVDQRATNHLEKAVRSFTAMQSKCPLSRADVTFRRPLPVFRVVRCSSVHCFQTRITLKLFRCTRAPIAR